MPEQGIRNILETNVKIENIDKKQKMQRRDMKSLKLETKIPETIQSEPRKIQKKRTEPVEQEQNSSICVIRVPEVQEKIFSAEKILKK